MRMNCIYAFILVVFVACGPGFLMANGELNRSKRSMLGFHTAIKCYNRKVNVIGSYVHYGCYCGFSGNGEPLDETDRCCYNHDHCYEEAEKLKPKGNWFSDKLYKAASYMTYPYESECTNGTIVCLNTTDITEADHQFRKALCNCDRNAGICFARWHHTFRPQLYNVPGEYCRVNASRGGLNMSIPNQKNRTKIYIDDDGFLITVTKPNKKDIATEKPVLQKVDIEEKDTNKDVTEGFDSAKNINTVTDSGTDKSASSNGDSLQISDNTTTSPTNTKDSIIPSGGGKTVFTVDKIILVCVCAFVLYLLCWWKLFQKRLRSCGKKAKEGVVKV